MKDTNKLPSQIQNNSTLIRPSLSHDEGATRISVEDAIRIANALRSDLNTLISLDFSDNQIGNALLEAFETESAPTAASSPSTKQQTVALDQKPQANEAKMPTQASLETETVQPLEIAGRVANQPSPGFFTSGSSNSSFMASTASVAEPAENTPTP